MSSETARLRLVPYTPQQLLALTAGVGQFEEHSEFAAEGLREFFASSLDEISPAWLEALRNATRADPWVYGFAVVHRDTRLVIGSAGFKGPPDEDEMVEIAYGIVPSFQGQGYATEAAAALVAFASRDERVRLVRAHTFAAANASTRVLAKCGFAYVGEVVDPEDGLVSRWERGRLDSPPPEFAEPVLGAL